MTNPVFAWFEEYYLSFIWFVIHSLQYHYLLASLAKLEVCPTNLTGACALMASSHPPSSSFIALRDRSMKADESVAASHKSELNDWEDCLKWGLENWTLI